MVEITERDMMFFALCEMIDGRMSKSFTSGHNALAMVRKYKNESLVMARYKEYLHILLANKNTGITVPESLGYKLLGRIYPPDLSGEAQEQVYTTPDGFVVGCKLGFEAREERKPTRLIEI